MQTAITLDGIGIHDYKEEISQSLIGSFISKITQPTKQTLQFFLRQQHKNICLLLSAHPQNALFYKLESPLENPAVPSTFCMTLRKHLEGGRLSMIRQHQLDRVLFFDIDLRTGSGKILTKTLVLELVGNYSNFVLLEDGKILDALYKFNETQNHLRQIEPGVFYEPPPISQKVDVRQENFPEKFLNALKLRDKDEKILTALSGICLGMGKWTAREICLQENFFNFLEETNEKILNDVQRQKKFFEAIQNFFENKKISPHLLMKREKILGIVSFAPKKILEHDSEIFAKSFLTFDELFQNFIETDIFQSFFAPTNDEKKILLRLVKNELKKAITKRTKLQRELNQAEDAESFKIKADNLSTYRYQIPEHEKIFSCENIYDGSPLQIALDVRYNVTRNIELYYKKYTKLKRGAEFIQEQIQKCDASILYLQSVENSLEVFEGLLGDLFEIKQELIHEGYVRASDKKIFAMQKKNQQSKPTQPLCFKIEGAKIFVGKNNVQNNFLTFKMARKEDIWFHVKDLPSSHVILQLDDAKQEATPAMIEEAARLAVKFSPACHSSNVPVDFTQVRYVKKPIGAKLGFVIFTHQKTIFITPKEE